MTMAFLFLLKFKIPAIFLITPFLEPRDLARNRKEVTQNPETHLK